METNIELGPAGERSRSPTTQTIGALKKEATCGLVFFGGDGRAGERWKIFQEILKQICTVFEHVLFDTLEIFLIFESNWMPSASTQIQKRVSRFQQARK